MLNSNLIILLFTKILMNIQKKKKKKFTLMNINHMKAVLFRRLILFRRSIKSILISISIAIYFTVLSILVNFLMKKFLKDTVRPITFNSFLHQSDQIVIARPDQNEQISNFNLSDSNESYERFINSLNAIFYQDTGRYPNITEFPDLKTLNEWMYSISKDKASQRWPKYITMGISINNNLYNNFTGIYNSSWIRNEEMTTRVQLSRIIWRLAFSNKYKDSTNQNFDFTFSTTLLLEKVKDLVFGMLAPMLITCGLSSIVPLVISQPVIDINGEVRQYMISYGLTLFPYWLVTFFVDFILWTILVNSSFVIFIAFNITAIKDNLFNYWYTCMMAGPSFLLFIYCCSFMFSSPESGTRQMFIILIVLLIIPLVIDIINDYVSPNWILWFYALVPHVGIQRTLNEMLQRVSFFKEKLPYYWKTNFYSSKYLIMQLADIPIYSLILFILEKSRIWLQKKRALKTFENYSDFFRESKRKRIITDEARRMEEDVIANNSNYVVRILNCSRLFFNTAGKPIAAVNNVSLGIKDKSVFGFLGANGAGKTTLIRMIMSMLPPSHGSIEINGHDISKSGKVANNSKVLSICPQFNSHLCDEMTPREHFKLYRYLIDVDDDELNSPLMVNSEELIQKLALSEHADKTVREMSGGNQRKLAVALSFFSPASIILLDEPTSSLDPVARHDVHEMIKEFRGRKTFMICTHILGEAESLCDMISIMIKGCIYTCGSPQYLSEKFGKEYKIDIILNNKADENCQAKCDNFFQTQLPNARLAITRPNVRVYAIPSDSISISKLFRTMEEGLVDSKNGYNYYTCSSSSLERVFMEIIHLSENEEETTIVGN